MYKEQGEYNRQINSLNKVSRVPERSKVNIGISPEEYVKILKECNGEFFGLNSIDENIRQQRIQSEKYEKLDDMIKKQIEMGVVAAAHKTNPMMMQMIRDIGKYYDEGFVDYLEEKYSTNIDSLKIFVKLNLLENIKYNISKLIESRDDFETADARFDEKVVTEMKNSLNILKSLKMYSLLVTHTTTNDRWSEISSERRIVSSSEFNNYEGKGVYVGVFGSYREWVGGEKIVRMNINMKDASFLSMYKKPDCMANILCEYIDTEDIESKNIIVPKGIIEWHDESQNENSDNAYKAWVVDMLGRILPGSGFTFKDSILSTHIEEYSILTFDNKDISPLEYSYICKAFAIKRCMSSETYYNRNMNVLKNFQVNYGVEE